MHYNSTYVGTTHDTHDEQIIQNDINARPVGKRYIVSGKEFVV